MKRHVADCPALCEDETSDGESESGEGDTDSLGCTSGGGGARGASRAAGAGTAGRRGRRASGDSRGTVGRADRRASADDDSSGGAVGRDRDNWRAGDGDDYAAGDDGDRRGDRAGSRDAASARRSWDAGRGRRSLDLAITDLGDGLDRVAGLGSGGHNGDESSEGD